ncbi:MAG: radical SAM protein [Oligoflexia bacterium]|nr:radical SAM protein [Oligoflexia bacterium]
MKKQNENAPRGAVTVGDYSSLIFGPIHSRRLGTSLGIDLTPHKHCSLNCIYCECGSTTHLEITRQEYFPVEWVLTKIENFFQSLSPSLPPIDFVTFSGNGEPTLYSKIGTVIKFLKQNYPQYQLALITNGTLLADRLLQQDLLELDLIIPTLNAVTPTIFTKINRPSPELSIENVLQGITDFSLIFGGKIWIEIFVVPGLNDNEEEFTKIKEYILNINKKAGMQKISKIQLNSIDRPGSEKWISPPSENKLKQLQQSLLPLSAEIIPSKYLRGI